MGLETSNEMSGGAIVLYDGFKTSEFLLDGNIETSLISRSSVDRGKL